MSGILANSASKTMLAAATAPDNVATGYVVGETIALGVTPTPTSVVWALARPVTAGTRAALDEPAALSPTFTPSAAGFYVVSAVVDGSTTYVLRLSVAAAGEVAAISALRFQPLTNAQVPTPATGRTVYFSSDAGALVEKRPDGTVHPITVT